MSVVVPTNSSISDVTELSSVQAPTGADGSNIEALLSQIKSDKGVNLTTDTVDSYQAAYENLINGSSQAMVLNSAYSSLLELSYDNYESNLKTIYTYKVKKNISMMSHHQIKMSLISISVVLILMVQSQQFLVQMLILS